MAEPFKEWMNIDLVNTMGDIFTRVYKGFDREAFCEAASKGLSEMELKERIHNIMVALDTYLPDDFDEFSKVALAALDPSEDASAEGKEFGPDGLHGFAVWPLTDLVAKRGLHTPEKALPVLKEVTKRFSAEFAIRPFLDEHTDYTLQTLHSWLGDPNRHVRRLISEGTRPRLPWGMRLNAFVKDPTPIIPLLDALKNDEEEYVRRSVANNLNDIAKDHPSTVASIARDWLQGANRNRERLVRHACRTLLKKGHADTLEALGYFPATGLRGDLSITTPSVVYGEALEFSLDLSEGPQNQPVMVDYAIHFVKANGSTAPKVFKWKDSKLNGKGTLSGTKKHAIKPITTRVYYPGEHKLEVIVNGVSVAMGNFTLVM